MRLTSEKSEIKEGGGPSGEWLSCPSTFIIQQQSTTKLFLPVACTFELNNPENPNDRPVKGIALLNPSCCIRLPLLFNPRSTPARLARGLGACHAIPAPSLVGKITF